MAATQTAATEFPGLPGMPEYKPGVYTPSDPNAAGPPPITPPPPSAIGQEPAPNAPRVLPKNKAAGIAYMADSVLRGFMKGRDQAQQKQAYNINKLMQGFQYTIKTASDEYLGILQNSPETAAKLGQLQSGKDASGNPLTPDAIKAIQTDPNVVKAQQADAAAYSAWTAQQRLYSNYINPQKKTKGGKSKSGGGGGDQSGQSGQQENPLELLQSQNPMDKAKGYLLISQKVGPPWRREAAYLMSPQYQQAIKNAQGEQQITSDVQGKKLELHKLQNMDAAALDADGGKNRQRLAQLQDDPELFPQLAGRRPSYAPGTTPGSALVDRTDPRSGLPLRDKYGQPFDPKKEYRQETVGGEESWIEATPRASEVSKPGSPQAFVEEWARENGYTDPKTVPADIQRQLHQAFNAPGGGVTVRNGEVLWTDVNNHTWSIPIKSTTERTGPAMPKATPPTWAPGAKLTGGSEGTATEDKFNTKLTPAEEQQFQEWKKKYAPNDSGADYDLRGAFKAGLKPDPKTGHWPDTFKKPNHPTFSNESKYAKDVPDRAGHWEGPKHDQYVPPSGQAAGGPTPPVKGARLIGTKGLTPEEKLQNALRSKDHTTAKKIVDDAKKDYDGALTRVDTMDKNLKAALNGDQQAMLSLVANHIGMTLGAQKGARITRAVWDEAVESAPWLQVKVNKWFHQDPATGDMIFDGYKSGVTLTPEQMHQMVNLAHEKVDTLKRNIPVLEELYKKDLEAAPTSGSTSTPSGPHAVDSILDEKFGKPPNP